MCEVYFTPPALEIHVPYSEHIMLFQPGFNKQGIRSPLVAIRIHYWWSEPPLCELMVKWSEPLHTWAVGTAPRSRG